MKVKRLLSLTAAILLIFTMLPQAVFADSGDPAMSDGGAALERDVNSQNAQILHYGGKTWYVIGYNGNGAASVSSSVTLLAAENFGHTKYDSSGNNSNAYGTSTLKTAIEAIAAGFSSGERSAVIPRTLEGGSGNLDTDTYDSNKISGADVTAQLWPLSVAEANKVNNDLRIADPEHTGWLENFWWLRSPGINDRQAASVSGQGDVVLNGYNVNASTYEFVVRPAFYLNLGSVLFTSAAEGGKSCTEGELTQIGTSSTKEWKVTLKDGSRTFSAEAVSENDNSIDIKYSSKSSEGSAIYGINEYISAVVKNSEGQLTYYGRLKNVTTEEAASGTLTVSLPDDWTDTDTLYVFSEQYNGEKKTDHASELVEIEAVVPASFTITFVNEDGTELQSGQVAYGETPEYTGKTPTKEADAQYTYAFNNWIPEITAAVEDATYKAEYTATVNKYDLTFDLNGGTLNGQTGKITMTYEYGAKIKLPDAPTKEGYKFLYWKGSQYEAGAEYTVDGPHDFTAVWEKVETSPKTGDNNQIIIWHALLGGAIIAGISILIVALKKKQQ